MPTVNKKPCVNNSKFTYSGKECSPLGKGYSADAEQIGTIMEGRDGSMWMVGIKNGVKVWNRVPNDLASEAESVSKSPVASPKKDKETPVVKKKPSKSKINSKISETESSESEIEKEPIKLEKPVGRKVEIKDEDEEDDDDIKEEAAAPSPVKVKRTYNKKKKDAAPPSPPSPPPSDNEDKTKIKTKPKKTDDKKTRQPTDFNYFVAYQLKIISQENPTMSHAEKFGLVASQWTKLSDDEKKAVLLKAKA
jgi:hypothetical protein